MRTQNRVRQTAFADLINWVRVFLGGMVNAEDLHVFALHSVGHDVIFVGHKFAGSCNTACPSSARKMRQQIGFLSNLLHKTLRPVGVVFGDMFSNEA